MIVLTADSIFELLTHGPCMKGVARQIDGSRGLMFSGPNLLIDVAELLSIGSVRPGVEETDLKSRVAMLEDLPCVLLPFSDLIDELLGLRSQDLSLSDSLYVATARVKEGSVLTTRRPFAERVEALCSIIYVT